MGGSFNVNVDMMSCGAVLNESNFIDKYGGRRLVFLELHVCLDFPCFSKSFQIFQKIENILQLSLNKMGCIASLNRRGGTFCNVNVDTR